MIEKAKNYTDLLFWQKLHSLVIDAYKITKQFSKEEKFGLTSQLKRPAISIPPKITEEFARNGSRDKLRFYNIALGSLNEVNYFLFSSKDLGYIAKSDIIEMFNEIGRKVNGYAKAMKSNSNS